MSPFETITLKSDPDYLAPDGSEIRSLLGMDGGNLSHCTLPEAKISAAVMHKTVDEIWYCLQGHGRVWRKWGEDEEEVLVHKGVSLTFPVGTHFQFRNTGAEPLCFIISTMPPWPGSKEAKYGIPINLHRFAKKAR
jgi:mannose-6-phosphate isomerase-like protein (cupin superfamily)